MFSTRTDFAIMAFFGGLVLTGLLFLQNIDNPVGAGFSRQAVIDAIPATIQVGNESLAFDWTDDNTGEDLIIRTNKRNFYSWAGSDVVMYVSVTNAHKFDQNVGLTFSFADNRFTANKMYRLTGNASTTIEEVIALPDDPNGVPTTQTVEILQPQWQEIILGDLSGVDTTQITRKDIQNTITQNGVGVFAVASGQTVVFKVYVDIPKDAQGEEFFLEAFGDRGAYGHLDPNPWTLEDLFNSDTKSTGDLNGQDGWSGSTNVDIVTTDPYEGDQHVECVATCNANIANTFGPVSDSGAIVYVAIQANATLIGAGALPNGDGTARIYPSAGSGTIRGLCGYHSETIKWGHGGGSPTLTTLDGGASPTADQWYVCQMEFYDDGTYRARLYNTSSETWGSWTSADYGYNTTDSGDLYGMNLNIGGRGNWRGDMVTPNDPFAVASVEEAILYQNTIWFQ